MPSPSSSALSPPRGRPWTLTSRSGACLWTASWLQEDYVNDLTYLDEGTQFPLTLGEGELFLMGDNRNRSSDSRDERLGAVDERLIIGKAVLRLYFRAGIA
ncbi:MAG: S26 family signal peptidase [Oscillospiraceae bacterium]